MRCDFCVLFWSRFLWVQCMFQRCCCRSVWRWLDKRLKIEGSYHWAGNCSFVGSCMFCWFPCRLCCLSCKMSETSVRCACCGCRWPVWCCSYSCNWFWWCCGCLLCSKYPRLVEHSMIVRHGKIQRQLLHKEYTASITKWLSTATYRKNRAISPQNALESLLLPQP